MDTIVSDLVGAAEQVLTHCKINGGPVDTWAFEEGSEAYLALSEAEGRPDSAISVEARTHSRRFFRGPGPITFHLRAVFVHRGF